MNRSSRPIHRLGAIAALFVGLAAAGSGAFLRRLAGRVETGRPSTSDPALA